MEWNFPGCIYRPALSLFCSRSKKEQKGKRWTVPGRQLLIRGRVQQKFGRVNLQTIVIYPIIAAYVATVACSK
jgi:hypothetical protein